MAILLVPTTYSTIQAAVNAAVSGDMVLVDDGTYNEQVQISTDNIQLLAVNPGLAIISGNNHTIPTPNTNPGTPAGLPCTVEPYTFQALVQIDANDVTLDGFTITESGGDAIRGIDGPNSFFGTPYSGTLIQNCIIHNNRRSAIRTGGHSDIIVQDCEIYNNVNFAPCSRSASLRNWPGCVNLKHGNNPIFRRNILYNNWGEGLSAHDSNDGIFEDNIIYDNYAMGIYIHYCNRLIVRNNLMFWSNDDTYFRSGRPSAHIVINMEGNFSANDPSNLPEVYPPHTDIIIENNVITGRSERAIAFWGNNNLNITDKVTVRNNTIYAEYYNNGSTNGLIDSSGDFANYTEVIFHNNIVYATNSTQLMTITDNRLAGRFDGDYNKWGTALTSTDATGPNDRPNGIPDLVNPIVNIMNHLSVNKTNYYQNSTAGTIDTGNNANSSSDDFIGTVRPFNTTSDIGAHEYNGGVVSNNPPTVVILTQSNDVGDIVSYTVTSNDVDGDILTYSASGLPTGLSINSITGTISGVTTTSGIYSYQVTVNDGQDTGTSMATWTVNEIVIGPTEYCFPIRSK